MKRIIRSAARDDILRQFRYYLVDQARPEVAHRFVEAVEKTIGKRDIQRILEGEE